MDNLGYITDHFFLEEEYKHERDDINAFSIITSPNQPSFFYGNYLLLDKAMVSDTRLHWESAFDAHFGKDERIRHYTFCWGGEMESDYADFVKHAYEKEELVVLVMNEGGLNDKTKKEFLGITRPFSAASDWDQWTELNVLDENPGKNEAGYRTYLQGRQATYETLIKNGYGNIYGIFIKGELAATAGLFIKKRVGRFQNVMTSKSFRRKGLCSSLISTLSNIGFYKQAEQLVIVADKHYHAMDLYKNLGFKHFQSQSSLCKRKYRSE